MSWLFSSALVKAYENSRSSQALVAGYSEATCSDGEPFAPSSGSPTPRAYLSPDKMTTFSRLSRFGMTFAPLTDTRGEELLTWFRAGFRVRTSALPERAQASKASDPACGAKWPASLAKFDPATSSWRTPQPSLFADLEPSSVTWPRWGSMRNGECWERPMWERRTRETESGYWLTPCATDAKPITGGNLYQTKTGTVRHMHPDGKSSNRGLAAQVMWPTPMATDGTKCPSASLPRAVNPELRATFRNKAEGLRWPTPTARDYRSDSASPEWTATRQEQTRGKPLPFVVGGTLNPTWVEWLMGWPLGWTDLKPLATDKSRNALPRRGAG